MLERATSARYVLKAEEIAAIRELARSGSGDITTKTILAQAIIIEGLKHLATGVNLIQLKDGIDKATEAIVNYIRAEAVPVETKADIAHIASISSANETIGIIIADIMDRIGLDGVIHVEESLSVYFETEYIGGMQFNRGYISAYFVTNPEKMEASIKNPYILITDKKISAVQDILPILEKIVEQGKREIIIIAEDVDGEALATLVVNKLQGTLNVLAVKAPGYGDLRKEMLYDIAVLTGGQVISEEMGRRLDNTTLADLGSAQLVISHKDDTMIVEGNGETANIQTRIRQIKAQIHQTTSDYDREKLQERLAKLAGGVGLIKVGGFTREEITERKLLVETAIIAVYAAIEEGFVAKGTSTLIAAIPALDKVLTDSSEEQLGVDILRHALEEPLRQIARNAGYKGDDIVAEVLKRRHGYGFDTKTGKCIDMFKAGIVEPSKMISLTVQEAVNIAGKFLTTKTLEDG